MTNIRTAVEQNFWRSRFIILLAFTIAAIILSAFVDEGPTGRVLEQITFSSLAILAAFISAGSRRLVVIVGALVTLWFIISLLNFGMFHRALTGVEIALLIALSVIIFVIVEKTVLLAPAVDLNVLCGGIACYLLISVIWALCFAELVWLHPGSIRFPDNETAHWGTVMYFSLTCLTSIGFGDVLPIHPLARIWATLEGAVGVIYISVLIARLMTLYRVGNPQS